MSDWDSLDERSYDCLQAELTRLRARESAFETRIAALKNQLVDAEAAAEVAGRLRAQQTVLVEIVAELTAGCPDCGGIGTVYMLMDETEIGQPPGSSGRICRRCLKARKALANPSGE